MKTTRPMTLLVIVMLAGSQILGLPTPDAPAAKPLAEKQLQRIRPAIHRTQAETARLQTRLAHCQSELAALYAHYDLDEPAAHKIQDEIVDLQRQLLTSHHRLQKALRETVDAGQFERLRRRLEQAAPPNSGQKDEPAAPPAR
jgi:septal ring factor EnvC (AmiA/AmiB activator)